jgi:hypothetical protein
MELEIRRNSISLSFGSKGAGIAAATREGKHTSKSKATRSEQDAKGAAGESPSPLQPPFVFHFPGYL